MKQFFFILCLSLIAFQALAGDCSNPLLVGNTDSPIAQADIKATPEKVTGLTFCKNLEGKDACCAKDKIELLKSKFEEMKNGLKNSADQDRKTKEGQVNNNTQQQTEAKQKMSNLNATRQKIAELLDIVSPCFNKETGQIIDSEVTNLASNVKLNSVLRANTTLLQHLCKAAAGMYNASRMEAGKNFSDNTQAPERDQSQNFTQYLKKKGDPANFDQQFKVDGEKLKNLTNHRQNCMKLVLQHHASMLCLQCDADYASKNVTKDGNQKPVIALKTEVCDQLKAACFPMLQQEVEMNKIEKEKLEREIQKRVEQFKPTDTNDQMQIVRFILSEFRIRRDLSQMFRPKQLPPNCPDQANCAFVCEQFLRPRGGNKDKVLNGTQSQQTVADGTPDVSPPPPPARLLQTNDGSTSYSSTGFNSISYSSTTGADTSLTLDGSGGSSATNLIISVSMVLFFIAQLLMI